MEATWLFALLVFGIIAMPGMDMAFVLSSTLVDGRRAGWAAVAGIVAGGMVHVALSTLGIGLVLRVWPSAFNLLLTAGALYVAWMGWSLWRHPGGLTSVGTAPSRTARSTFGRALATCLLNPKAYVFMLAVFPQFISAGEGALLPQVLLLSAIIAVTQLAVYGGVALGAEALRIGLVRSAALQVAVARCVAVLLLATAAWTVWHGWAAS